jgi:PPE-repeat protein
VDKETLIAAYEALVQANAVYNGEASTVSEYQAAKEALNTPIATLNEYKEGYHKAQLKSMVDLLTALIEKCNTEGQGDLTAGMLEEMVQINETATAYLTQEFATHEVLVSTIQGAISDIEANYPTWSAAQQSTAKQDLLAKIEQLQNLIDECRATGTKIITTDVPCALQTTSPNAPLYLSTNATDSEGVIANLVPTLGDTTRDVRIIRHVFTDEEECRVYTVLVQYFKNLGRVSRMRAIIKGQCNLV